MSVSVMPSPADAERRARALKAAERSFGAFKTAQTHINFVLRASEVALRLAPEQLETLGLRDDDELARLGRGRPRLRPVLSQYKVVKHRKVRPVTVGQFKEHLDLARDDLYRSLVVFYLSAFEQFLEGWGHAALMLMHEGKQEKPVKELAKLINSPNQSVTIQHIAEAFKADAGQLLRETLPLGTKRDAGELGDYFRKEGISCFEITQMWRQLRNVIVHHDGRLDKIRDAGSGATWEKIREQGRPRKSADAGPSGENRVTLLGHHVVHCFTHTHRTAEVLMEALKALAKNPGG